MKSYFLKTFLVCCLAVNTAHAQMVVNGDFSANGSGFCDGAPVGWNASIGNPGGVELTDVANNGDWWIDLTDCVNWGNDRYIEQTIPTIPGHIYGVGFDLGCWNDAAQIAAGVSVSAPGVNMTFTSDDLTGTPLKWHRYGFCFTAGSTQSTITFVCAPQLTSSSPGWAMATNPNPPYDHHTAAVGLDNIVVVDKGYDVVTNGSFQVGAPPSGNIISHMTPNGWNASTIFYASGDMELSDMHQPNNFWIDLTDNASGDGRWVEQKVPSADNMMYRVAFHVGAGKKDNAAVDLYIDNVYKGTATSIANGSPLRWTGLYYCDFMASGGWTSIKFVAKSPWGLKPDIVGLDNVSMVLKCCFAKMTPGFGTLDELPPCDCPPKDGKKYSSTSIENVSGDGSPVSVYPNPVQTVLNIQILQGKGTNARYKIHDVTGRELLSGDQQVNAAAQLSIPVQQLPAGNYIIEIEGSFPTIKQKFVKE